MIAALDAITGASMLLVGILGWGRFRTSALFAVAAAGAWFVVPVVPELVLLHRPLLIHSFLALPRGRVGGAGAWSLLTVAWVGVVLPPPAQPWVSVITGALCIAVAGRLYAPRASADRPDVVATRRALLLLGAGLALPVFERTVWPTYAEAGLPIATYMFAVTLGSAAMIRGILTPTRQETDAVVELSDDTPGQALAEFRTLAEVEADPRRREALRSAIVLLEDNARLQRELAQRIEEVRASRARLIDAAFGERRRLERVLGEGALRYLSQLEDCLASIPQDAKGDATMAPCLKELARTREDLEQLARGLHSRTLADRGLAAALEELSRRSPVHVESSAPAGRFPPRIETTIWYVCAEALTNVWKYSHATTAVVRVEESRGVLTASVQDDGCGGARLSPGGGLTGLVDRVSDVGGRLVLTSGAAGTDVTVTVPLR